VHQLDEKAVAAPLEILEPVLCTSMTTEEVFGADDALKSSLGCTVSSVVTRHGAFEIGSAGIRRR
jgi:hypothetical protein